MLAARGKAHVLLARQNARVKAPAVSSTGRHARPMCSAAASASGSEPEAAAGVAVTKPSTSHDNGCSGSGGDSGNGSRRRPVGFSGDDDDSSNSSSNPSRPQRSPFLHLLLYAVLPACFSQLLLAPAALAGSRQGLVSRKEEHSLPQWEIDAFVDRMWELSGPIVNNMGFSGLLGAAAAAALKFVGRTLAASVGMCLVLVQVLSYYDIVTVNWSVVHEQARTVLDRTGDGRLDKDDFKRAVKKWMIVLSEGVPSVSGFLLGFLVGMRLF